MVPWWRVQLSVQHPDLHQHPDQHQHPDPSLTSKRTRMLTNRMKTMGKFMKAPALAGRLGGQNRTRRTASSSAFGCRSARSAALPCWIVTSPSWGCAAVARGRHSTQVRSDTTSSTATTICARTHPRSHPHHQLTNKLRESKLGWRGLRLSATKPTSRHSKLGLAGWRTLTESTSVSALWRQCDCPFDFAANYVLHLVHVHVQRTCSFATILFKLFLTSLIFFQTVLILFETSLKLFQLQQSLALITSTTSMGSSAQKYTAVSPAVVSVL
eukprot:SAG31_NODE_5909_length_2261_cov_15.842738_1_plen_270_part_00